MTVKEETSQYTGFLWVLPIKEEHVGIIKGELATKLGGMPMADFNDLVKRVRGVQTDISMVASSEFNPDRAPIYLEHVNGGKIYMSVNGMVTHVQGGPVKGTFQPRGDY